MADTQHLVVRALAGSGKTQSLSLRYLKLLGQGAEPGQILATTFTRKAAGEILSRVLTLLAGASVDQGSARALGRQLKDERFDLAAARGMLERVTASIHRVQVSTLDACFHRMAMCFRFELGLASSPRLIDAAGPLARQLRRRAIDAMLAEEQPSVLVEMLRRLQHDQARRSVSEALDGLFLELYEPWRNTAGAAWRQLEAPKTLSPSEVVDAIDRLSEAGDQLPEDQRLAKAWKKDYEAAANRDWTKLLTSGLGPKTLEDSPMYQKKAIPQPVIDAYHPVMIHARAVMVMRTAHKTQATAELFERFDRHYRRFRREEGVILFNDLPHLLDEALGANGTPESKVDTDQPSPAEQTAQTLAELYYRLDQRTSHLLLDEFQDTSPTQWRILRPIAEEICAGLGAEHSQTNPAQATFARSFFCVGDLKQAIFGWRGGQAALFDAVVSDLHLPPTSVHSRNKSYRSSPAVLDVVNQVFEDISNTSPLDPDEKSKQVDKDQARALQRAAAAWERGFQAHQAVHANRPGYVEMAASPTPAESEPSTQTTAHAPTDGGSERTEAENKAAHLDYVADRIAQLATADTQRSIGVLVRKNDTAVDLLGRLRDLGIAASTDSGAGLDSDPAVELILSALTLADHPGHSAAAYHVLHSPLAEPLGFGTDQCADLAQVAGRIRRDLLDLGYGQLLTRWVGELAAVCNRTSVERLTQLIELAQAHEANASLRTGQFIEAVRSQRVPDPASARVRLLTVHKAKGLEFDITVLGELDQTIGQVGKQQLWRYRPSPTEPPTAVFSAVDAKLRTTLSDYEPVIGQAYDQEQASRVSDDLSLLYVAMTRAKFALYMFLRPLKQTKAGWSSVGLTNYSYAALLRAQLTDMTDIQEHGTLYTHGNPRWDEAFTHMQTDPGSPAADEPHPPASNRPHHAPRLDKNRSPGRSWPTMTPSALQDDQRLSVRQLLDPEASYARQVGTRMHALLERIAWFDDFDHANAPADLHAVLQHESVRNALRKHADHQSLWRERAFAVRLDGQLCQGKFDRVVITEDPPGQPQSAHLIDFKTEAHTDAAVQRYQPQLRTYRRALTTLLGLPEADIRTTLLFLTDGTQITDAA